MGQHLTGKGKAGVDQYQSPQMEVAKGNQLYKGQPPQTGVGQGSHQLLKSDGLLKS